MLTHPGGRLLRPFSAGVQEALTAPGFTASRGGTRRSAMSMGWKAAALVGALSLTLAACGGGDDEDGVATLGGGGDSAAEASASPSVDPEDALAEFAECMRDNGVEDFPDPTVDEDGRIEIGFVGGADGDPSSGGDREEMADAMEACQDLLPRGEGPGQVSEEDRTAFQDALVEYAECMREHGIDMPDPEFSGDGGFLQEIGEGIDPEDPDFQAADEACRPALEEALPGGPGGEVSTDEGE
jgi:hypothetical protein